MMEPEKKMSTQAEAKEISEYERCVCCGKKTNIRKSLNISEREFYIEGGGQLCHDCYYELYCSKDLK